jgi:hypothetical protein
VTVRDAVVRELVSRTGIDPTSRLLTMTFLKGLR